MSPETLGLEDVFVERAVAAGATRHASDPTLGEEFLDTVEHRSSFPGVAVPAARGAFHPPATCYRLFRDLAGARLPGSTVVAITGPCRRAGEDDGPGRMEQFTMTEQVFLGTGRETERWRDALMDSERAFAESLGLDVGLVPAGDVFFGAAEVNRGKRLMQQLLGLKYELVAPIEGEPVAISSFNRHLDFFTSRLDIEIEGVEAAQSGCVAYGAERWVAALVERWGPEVERWDPGVRLALAPP